MIEQILAWADSYHERTADGRRPAASVLQKNNSLRRYCKPIGV